MLNLNYLLIYNPMEIVYLGPQGTISQYSNSHVIFKKTLL